MIHMFTLAFFSQPRLEIMMPVSTHTDMYQNSASCRTRQRTWSFASARAISNWKASDRLKRNSTFWIKSNGSTCTVSTFIPCWYVWDQLTIDFNYASRAKRYLTLLILIEHSCFSCSTGRRQRRIFSRSNAERNYRAPKQVECSSLLLASDSESLFQRTILHDTCLRQKRKSEQDATLNCKWKRMC